MGLFSKKQPEIGGPVFIDMRISEEQLPEEVLSGLRGNMWFMGFPEKLSDWAVISLGAENHPSVKLLPQDGDPSKEDPNKTIHPIHISIR